MEPVRLFTPGPVAVHPEVLRAAAQQPFYHRHSSFAELLEQLQHRLQWLFQTRLPVVLLTCSATGAHEAVARMLHDTGSQAIVCVHGRFGKRWAQLLRLLGVQVHCVEAQWGENIDPAAVETALATVQQARTLWVVHSETSTGVLAPVAEIIAAARRVQPEVVVCVDAVSSLGIHPVFTDQWGADVVIASSQKGVGGLPGLALVALSERCVSQWVQQPRTLYFDLRAELEALKRSTTLYTPAVTLFVALDAALRLIEQEGLQQRWDRYARDAAFVREQLQRAGYRLFGKGSSNAVTVGWIPSHCPNLLEELEHRYGFLIARGQEHYRTHLFRIGHCGWYRREDLQLLVTAMATLAGNER